MQTTKTELVEIIEAIDFNKCVEHPNILIAARLWDDKRYNAARVCYKFMRKMDDLVDERKALNRQLSEPEKKELTAEIEYLIRGLRNTHITDDLLKEVQEVMKEFKIPETLFYTFANSMLYDINHEGFPTLKSFYEYAEGASVAPASIFVHLCCLKQVNGIYSPANFNLLEVSRPCAIFSYLVHIIRDFQKDLLNNLNYFALDILHSNNLTPADLSAMARGREINKDFRNVIKIYCTEAERFRNNTWMTINNVIPKLEPRYLLSLTVIFSLYQQVYERIDIERGRFTEIELNPKPHEIKERVLEVVSNFQFQL
jgi:phytoene/squalene synthetase